MATDMVIVWSPVRFLPPRAAPRSGHPRHTRRAFFQLMNEASPFLLSPKWYVKLNRVCLTAFWDCRRHLEGARHMQNTLAAVPCHVWPPAQPDPAVRILRKWNAASLTVAQAVYESPAPGVTPIEEFTRSREANKIHNGAQHVSKTSTRNKAGQETNWATRTSWSTTSLENPWSCLDFVRSQQSCEVTPFHVFQTPNGPWGMSWVVKKLDQVCWWHCCPCPECGQNFSDEKLGV
jgi:hypothetical protein